MATTEQTVRTAALAVPGTRKVMGGILTVARAACGVVLASAARGKRQARAGRRVVHDHRLDHGGDAARAHRHGRLLSLLGAENRQFRNGVQRIRRSDAVVFVRRRTDRHDGNEIGIGAPAGVFSDAASRSGLLAPAARDHPFFLPAHVAGALGNRVRGDHGGGGGGLDRGFWFAARKQRRPRDFRHA